MVFDPSERETTEWNMGQTDMNRLNILEKCKGRIEGAEKVSGRDCCRVVFPPDKDEKFFWYSVDG